MTTELMPFTYEGGEQLRTIVIADGNPGFIANDVCAILDIRNSRDALARLDDDEKGVVTTDTLGGPQQMAYVTEAGLYALVFTSRKAEAREFKRWVTHEVLPTIRKTGGAYIMPGSQAELDLSNPDTALDKLIEVAQVAKAERARRLELEAKVEADAPKVEAYDQFMEADGNYLVGAVARMLGTSQNKLFAELRDRGVFIAKGAMRNTPYQRYMQHFVVKATSYTHSDGSEGVSYTTRVKPSGVDFIRRRLAIGVVAS